MSASRKPINWAAAGVIVALLGLPAAYIALFRDDPAALTTPAAISSPSVVATSPPPSTPTAVPSIVSTPGDPQTPFRVVYEDKTTTLTALSQCYGTSGIDFDNDRSPVASTEVEDRDRHDLAMRGRCGGTTYANIRRHSSKAWALGPRTKPSSPQDCVDATKSNPLPASEEDGSANTFPVGQGICVTTDKDNVVWFVIVKNRITKQDAYGGWEIRATMWIPTP